MEPRKLRSLLDGTIPVATQAGAAVFQISSKSLHLEEKSDGSPVTRADRVSHQIITAALTQLTPHIPVVSEEAADGEPQPPPAGSFWLVDPLDGTKEYIRGLADYTVNIALIEEGRPVLGVVHAPAIETLYFAAHGLGAHKTIGDCPLQPLGARPSVRPLTAVASRSHLNPETEAFMKKLGVQETIQRGSSIKMCAVADGQADVYPRIGPTHHWDTAAGSAVAREAGCLVLDLSGDDLSYQPTDDLLHRGFVVVQTHDPILVDRVRKSLGQA